MIFLSDIISEIKKLGIPAVTVEYSGTNYVNIVVSNIEDVVPAKKVINKKWKKIRDIVLASIKDKDVTKTKEFLEPTNWKRFCVSNVYSCQERQIETLVRKNKLKLQNKINKAVEPKFKSSFLFAHSGEYSDKGNFAPGYSYVFKDSKILKESKKSIQTRIIKICVDHLTEVDHTGLFDKKYFRVSFHQAEIENLYGLFRED